MQSAKRKAQRLIPTSPLPIASLIRMIRIRLPASRPRSRAEIMLFPDTRHGHLTDSGHLHLLHMRMRHADFPSLCMHVLANRYLLPQDERLEIGYQRVALKAQRIACLLLFNINDATVATHFVPPCKSRILFPTHARCTHPDALSTCRH